MNRNHYAVALLSALVVVGGTSAHALTATPSPTPTPTYVSELPEITFQPSQAFSVARNPEFMDVADFNRDGLPDIVISSPTSKKVSILLSDGLGSFSTGVSAGPVGKYLRSVAAGDIDGDGIVDVAVIDNLGDDVFIFLGNGDGSLKPPTALATKRMPWGIAIGQLDGQPGNDLAVTNQLDNTASIFFNRNTGHTSFAGPSNFPVSTKPGQLISGDFNDDGFTDLVALNTGNLGSNDVTELIGNGSGGFQSKGNFLVKEGARQMTVGDFNGDGFPDIAIVNGIASTHQVFTSAFTVLLSDGLGFFSQAVTIDVDCAVVLTVDVCMPKAIAAGDFDRDGNVDIAVGVSLANAVFIYAGNGDGTADFVGQPVPLAAVPNFMVAADFDDDGRLDLAVSESATGYTPANVQLLQNTSPFPPTPTLAPFVTPSGTVRPPVTPSKNQGQICSDDDECFTGFCEQERCCDRACNGQSERCDVDPNPGTCVTVPTPMPSPTPKPTGGGGAFVSRSGGCSADNGNGTPLGATAVLLVPGALWLGRRRILVRALAPARRRLR
ncbi:MAG: VCBS repeat-containing protein [Deltaproteobacteria bacterium]|nr:VCBS repeat-containing protein [Deltaproteobacteria bacterium]